MGGVTLFSHNFLEANSAHSFVCVCGLTFIIATEPKILPNRGGAFFFFTSPVTLSLLLAVASGIDNGDNGLTEFLQTHSTPTNAF